MPDSLQGPENRSQRATEPVSFKKQGSKQAQKLKSTTQIAFILNHSQQDAKSAHTHTHTRPKHARHLRPLPVAPTRSALPARMQAPSQAHHHTETHTNPHKTCTHRETLRPVYRRCGPPKPRPKQPKLQLVHVINPCAENPLQAPRARKQNDSRHVTGGRSPRRLLPPQARQ